jgi:hypothetical protein
LVLVCANFVEAHRIVLAQYLVELF